MKKVLILYAKYGGGHLSAANALSTFMKKNCHDAEVKVVDCVEYVTPFLSKVTTGAYKNMAKTAPKLWKYIYNNSPKGFLLKVSNISIRYLAKHLLEVFNSFKPDVVVSVHPFGSQLTAYLKEKGKINCKLATVFTDFETHPQWLVGKEFNDYFFVSNESMKQELLNLNIAENKVFITGVPLSYKFSENLDTDLIYDDLNLDKAKKTILFFGGGEYGLGRKKTVKMLRTLTEYSDLYQIIAISGRNKKMNREFLKIANETNNSSIHVFDYSNQVPELMRISDLVVTKSGGLTSSESLASDLPLLIINPIPGQEEGNAEFLEKSGAAIWIKKEDDIEAVINRVLPNKKILNEMKIHATQIAHPNSTHDICEIILK